MNGPLQPQIMSVQDMFTNCLFSVPNYQRAYAWEREQWDELWEDIREGMRTDTTHFLGTVILMSDDPRHDNAGRDLLNFQLVDGQQRTTTLCLLLLAAYDRLQQNTPAIANGLWTDFIEHQRGMYKIRLGNLNGNYFNELILAVQNSSNLPDDPDRRSTNTRIRDAFRRFQDLIHDWLSTGNGNVESLAFYMRRRLNVLRFVTADRSLAIKTFQTVNDRGMKLSLLEKSKSFLMFYITRYLPDDRNLLGTVENTFGRVFDNYDVVRDLARRFGVEYLVNRRFRFNEDEFLRYAYHYGAREISAKFNLEIGYEYGITPEQVFDDFIKGVCRNLREQPDSLRQFIVEWCEDLHNVSQALEALLRQIPEKGDYYQLFMFQGPSASVYPLLVTAQARGFLDTDMLNAIAVLDLRVYQVRGTDPKAGLYRDAISQMKTGARDPIVNAIVGFCQEFGSNQEIDRIMRGHVYGQSFTKYVLWHYAIKDETDVASLNHGLFAECQVDHIFARIPTFDVRTFGFESGDEYEDRKDGFGNLTLLEQGLNQGAQNVAPDAKTGIYANSDLRCNRLLGIQIGNGLRETPKLVAWTKSSDFLKRGGQSQQHSSLDYARTDKTKALGCARMVFADNHLLATQGFCMPYDTTKQSVLFENVSKKAVVPNLTRITPAPTVERFCSRRAIKNSS